MSGLAGIAAWLDDRLNPIVVKELRQAVQGRFVSAVLIVLLSIQLTVLTIYLLTSGVRSIDVVSTRGQGQAVFQVIFAFLLFVSIVVMPIFAAVRLYFERSGEALSLLFITTLPPWRIISGKLLSNQLLVLLLFVACLPYVSFTYFLRGIDLPSVLVVFAFGFVSVSVCLQGMILLACLPGHRVVKLLLGLASLVGLMMAFGFVLQMSTWLLRSGVGSRIASRELAWQIGGFLAVAGFLGGLFFLLAVAVVSPPAANRAPPLRLYLSVCWLLTGAGAVNWSSTSRDPDFVEFWIVGWILIAAAALAIAISSRDRMSARVARTIPAARWRRAIAFLFWSGSANGVAWALLVVVVTLGAGFLIDRRASGWIDVSPMEQVVAFAAYCCAYALTALLVHRRFLARRVPAGFAWALELALMTVGAVAPLVVGFLISPADFDRIDDEWIYWFLNPFVAFESRLEELAWKFGVGWTGVAGALALPWFLRQARAFRPGAGADVRGADRPRRSSG